MNKDKTGGPAFPTDTATVQYGMTLRDYFAAKAMAAAMSKTELNNRSIDDIATGAYRSADAMIRARGET